jgi:hypothetical protein
VLRHHGPAAGNGIVKNQVAPRGVVQNEAVPFQKLHYSTRLNRWKFCHNHFPVYQMQKQENQ